jgi:purine catabolism regulator
LLAPARRMVLRGDADSLELRMVLTASDDPGGLDLAGRIAGFLGRSVAVSRPFVAAGDRPAAEAEARATLEAIEALASIEPAAPPPPVARADRLAAYRLLGGLHNVPDGLRHARALLAPLLDDARPATINERLATLRAVLETPGAAEAASALGIHRNTLAYRIRRIEAQTGWRLADPDLRLPLAMAVRLVQSAQLGRGGGPAG